MRVMNSRTHRVEPFTTREPGVARMYVCGPSVYDDAHLGHARSYVGYDAMKRTLRALGLRVVHVQNFTDIEENIAERAKKRGVPPLEYASEYVGRFLADMDALGVERADRYTRVSEHIGDIIRIVKDLQENGYAYMVDCDDGGCDVYFSVKRVRDFGQLIGSTLEDLMVERPRSSERTDPLDFALWKSKDDWGVTWPSPWGAGRPGWHVECTAMSLKHLGADFDIHGGGLDLVFPHHESERVIGEAWSGQRFCNFYLHNGFVTVGERKMSKSLGNFVTVRDMLREHDAQAVRALLLSAHYRAPLNYSKEAIGAAEERVARWRGRIADLKAAANGAAPAAEAALAAQEARFWDALKDDFHFDRALAALDEALDAGAALKGGEAARALQELRRMGGALGLLWELQRD